ncbi:Cell division protein FtsW [hydrothermal vent metagenome]|uniref:peptidoglycan glycosyltransferase n=1 Tax=hydrothermal vent metagenome TaxID=652676 RepID=A0A3B1CQ82_9ZZZZ
MLNNKELMMESKENRRADRWLLFIVLLLSFTGVVMVYSSTALLSISKSGGVIAGGSDFQFVYLKKHVMTLVIAMVSMWFFYRISPGTLRKWSYPLLILSLLLLLCVFIPGLGVKINGARRWLKLWPSTFQPAELAKFAMVLSLAVYLSSPRYNRDSFKAFVKPLVVMVVFQGIIMMQPDFGGAFTLGLITFSMLFLAGTRMKFILLALVSLLPVVIKLLMEPYRLERLFTFLNPWKDPYGSGFQLVQSFIALGSGGLKGVGLGESRQKLSFLPEVNTDFIFSLIGEELGLLGVAVVLCLFIAFFIRGLKVADKAQSPFSYYVAFGLTMMITMQALINMSVVTGLVPTKGLPLPFISYGGSSLLVNFMAAGTLLRISRSDLEQYSLPGRDMLIKRRSRLRARRLRRSSL